MGDIGDKAACGEQRADMAKALVLIGQNKGVIGEITERKRGPRGHGMGGGQDRMRGDVGEGFALKTGGQAQIPGDGQIAAGLSEGFGKGVKPHDRAAQAQFGVAGLGKREEGGEELRGEVLEQGEMDLGPYVVAGEGVDLGKDCVRLGQPAAPEGGGHQPATGAAVKKRAREQRFELSQRHRQRRLADMKGIRGSGHSAMAGDGRGIFKLAQGEG